MVKYDADILFCEDLGPRASILCKELRIDVYVSHAETTRDILEAWKNSKIKKAGVKNVCE